MKPAAGYRHPAYIEALSEFGNPRELPRSGGWILAREIAGTGRTDATGAYPLFACHDWHELEADLRDVQDLVSLVVVPDPFGDHDLPLLRRSFPNLVRPFKEHFVRDLSVPADSVSSHHRYYARRARRSVHVDVCDEPLDFADEWAELYGNLIERH